MIVDVDQKLGLFFYFLSCSAVLHVNPLGFTLNLGRFVIHSCYWIQSSKESSTQTINFPLFILLSDRERFLLLLMNKSNQYLLLCQ